MKENTKSSTDDAAYVFRFKLKESEATKASVDPLVEMVRSFVADFLDLGCFTHKGSRVQVDGFYFTNNPERRYPVYDNRLPDNEIRTHTFKHKEEKK